MRHYCNSCGLRTPNNFCALTNMSIDPNNDYCSKYKSTLFFCDVCGAGILDPIVEIKEDKTVRVFCAQCANQLTSCRFCKNSQDCKFENDPSPIPKIIPQTFRQGNSIIETQIKNPERIRQFCENKCPCYTPENGCLRQFNYCSNWQDQ